MKKKTSKMLSNIIIKNRHNKTALGMTATAIRSRHDLDRLALTLAVKGTLDILGRSKNNRKRQACPYCGTKNMGKVVLNKN